MVHSNFLQKKKKDNNKTNKLLRSSAPLFLTKFTTHKPSVSASFQQSLERFYCSSTEFRMSKCFSFTETKNWCHRSAFTKAGLRSTVTDLKDGTVMHCWVPKEPKPNLLLLHGLGANAMWQWVDVVRHLVPFFNLYIPDLLFFGESYTSRPERGEGFQARCVMRVMEAHSVRRLSLVGLSYGGFVGYSLAAQYGEVVERVVICSAGVCMEEKDLREGLFPVSDLEEAAMILVPQTPQRLRELMGYVFFRPLPFGLLPSCLLTDFIDAMCREYVEEKRDLVRSIPKNRKLSDIPKIIRYCPSLVQQPTLIIWGEHDRVFPLELGHRLKRHLGENAQLVIIKNAGHAFNVEKPKEFYKHLKAFLVDKRLPPISQSPDPPQNHK